MKRFGWFGSLVAAIALTVHPAAARSQDLLTTLVQLVPPLLLASDQPVVPGNGYIWQPGYWAWSPDGYYYWVPGEWVLPPQPGYVWTPGYWADNGNGYMWNPGYWDTQVGYYGGVDYGDGYDGNGYVGGRWYGDTYRYNRAVTHINEHIRNVYVDNTVVVNRRIYTSYNGGRGGIAVRPTVWQQTFARQHHRGLTVVQQRHVTEAARDPHLRWTGSARKIAPSIRVEHAPAMHQQSRPQMMHQQQSRPQTVHQQSRPQTVHQQSRPQPVHHQSRPQTVHQQPVHQRPMHQQPVHQQPMRQQPVHQQPVHQQPAHQQPARHTHSQQAPHPHGTSRPG